ncbi:hypothetical protein QVD17_29725 [Tagetes erecta]|uniref:Protein kinase domain-containing protein n=1 Tax=Tagetes erecta TaxID=13708 RepID=A0AAD8NMT7_TARER|nr:hypothetical protein QVD17_29725 [Tagetes erecta]
MATTSEQLCRRYSLSDIQLATRNFDDELVIGRGGFGKVYKGHINGEGDINTSVAIKRLDSMSSQGAPEFIAEVETLSKLRHAHLVSLLGCCEEENEMILVYEYMPNETLYHHLHNSDIPLSWIQRLRIGIGAARGLDYLHTGVGTHHGVIHRDMKSSNILIDEDWAAKISDFGLAKLCPTNQSTYIHTSIKGTFGYMDPEIFMTGKFTRKTDVFAFGVVLFELLSGRHVVLPEDDDDLILARWAQNCVMERNLDRIVAPEIEGTLSPNSLKEFVQVAFCCLHNDPKERPTMSEVVVRLQLSLTLQEKFENYANMKFETYAKPVRRSGFTRKMLSYIFSSKMEDSSGHGDQTSSEDGDSYNERPHDDQVQIHAHHFKQFSYAELKHATRNFRNKMSSDRQGWVYKGRVDKKTYPSRMAIRVTSFHHRPEMDVQELGEFCHPNIHKVIGYCLEGETLYLVHEFMKERSLKDYLHNGLGELSFIKRVKVVVGVARGLLFLQRKRLIVKDWILDTNEIWIDKKFNAKLFYFDVARLLYRLQYPLVGETSQRRLCDVNGLGELLMEILTGKPVPLDYMGREPWSPAIALAYVKDIVDPQMRLKDTEIEGAREVLSLILKCTGYLCTLEQALKELEQIYTRMKRW